MKESTKYLLKEVAAILGDVTAATPAGAERLGRAEKNILDRILGYEEQGE